MANVCLPPKVVDAFKTNIANGKINPDALEKMSSEERHKLFSSVVGEGNAKFVNKEFETKMLLKNKQQGYLTWAKNLTGIKPAIRRDLISRIERMDARILNPADEKSFLRDLAEAKLGVGVKSSEAKQIMELSSKIQEADAKVQESVKQQGYTSANKNLRLQAGANKVALQNYMEDLKKSAAKRTLLQSANPNQYVREAKGLMGMAKGLVASMTSHAPLKHGFFALFEDPKHWGVNYLKQFSDAARSIGGKDVMSATKAEGLSRENAINGIYDKWIPGELTKVNEEFHSEIPEKIPVFGHAYKASKVMFDAFNLRMRMDLVDHYVNIVKKMGLDPNDKEVAKAWGKLAIDQSGGKTTNPDSLMGNFLFSQRLIKSQANNLTIHLFDKTATKEVKVQSAKTLAKVAVGLAAVIYTANKIHPGSAEYDPRSSDFGKIKIGDTRFDIAGGYGSLITLSARIAAAMDGKAAVKSSSTGMTSHLGSGPGQTSYQTLIGNFLQGRASPAGQIVADLANQQTFTGKKPTARTEAANFFTPIPASTYVSLKNDPNAANTLAVMIAQQLGLMSNTHGLDTSQPTISKENSASIQQFKQNVSAAKFNEAGQKYDKAYQDWLNKTKNDPRFTSKSTADQQKQIKGEKSHLKKTILGPYGYKPVKGHRQKTTLLNN